LCQTMQVWLDRPVSLKEGERGGPPAKVRNLVCDQMVRVEETDIEKGKLVKYQRLEGPEMSVDNEEGIVKASGPGLVITLQRGDAGLDPGAPPPVPSPTPRPQPTRPGPTAKAPGAASDELKLTRVLYSGSMHADNKKHLVIFLDNVHAAHVPSED